MPNHGFRFQLENQDFASLKGQISCDRMEEEEWQRDHQECVGHAWLEASSGHSEGDIRKIFA